MWVWPEEFIGACAPKAFAIALPEYARTWSFFCGIAAIMKLLGLVGRLMRRGQALATVLMVAGLFMSVLFWTIAAATLASHAPHSVTPLVFVGLALGAAWQLASWKPNWSRGP